MSAILIIVTGIFSLAAAWIADEKKIATVSNTLEFDTVYDEHFQFAWRSLRGLGVTEHAIDDAAQEVFLVVHRKLDTVKDPRAVKSWIFSIARRVASDHRRSHKRKGVSVEYNDERSSTDARTPQDNAEAKEILGLVEEFMGTLNDENRSIFVLSDIDQLSTPKVAEILDMNTNTVYSRVRAIRSDLEWFMASKDTEVKEGQK